MKNNLKSIGRLLRLLKPYKSKIIFIVILLLGSTTINIILPILTEYIIDNGFLQGDIRTIITLTVISFCLYLLDSLIQLIKEKQRLQVYTDLQFNTKQHAFEHLLNLPLDFFKSSNSSEILNTLEDDIDAIVEIADSDSLFMITEIFGAIGGTIGLFYINPKLAMIVLGYIPLKLIVSQILSSKNFFWTTVYAKTEKKYAKWFGDVLGGVKEIRQFGLGAYKKTEFQEIQEKIISAEKKKSIVGTLNNQSETILIQLLVAILYIVAGFEITHLQISIGGLVAFLSFTVSVTAPLSSVINVIFFFSSILPSVNRHFEFLDISEEANEGSLDVMSSEGNIEFRNVYFTYNDQNKDVFNDCSLCVQQGKKTAILGKNGQGKTTFLNLITRHIMPVQGEICYDNIPINEYDINTYRKNIAVINQEIYLFDDTLRFNICLYKAVSDSYLYEVLKYVDLIDLVVERGLDFQVGINGALLSGGQRQRIAIARAIIADTPILIFDEATSNLDTTSPQMMAHLFEGPLLYKTVICVTHDSDLLKYMDEIFLIADKKLHRLSLSDATKIMEEITPQ